MGSVLQSDDQRDGTSIEKSEKNSKIMKLVYNNFIYTKTF